jgi:hypothetical protein
MKVKTSAIVAMALVFGYIAPVFADGNSSERTFGDLDFEITKPEKHGAYSSDSWLLAQEAGSGLPDMGSSAAPATTPEYTEAQINEMMNNPLGELWLLYAQHDITSYKGDALDFLGEDDKIFQTTTLMPVMAMQLTKEWKYIFRPVIPIHTWDAPSISQGNTQYPGGDLPASVSFDKQTELGDVVLWNAFATNEMAKPPNIYGVGVTLMLDTATEDVFGTGKNSAGPMGLAFHIGPPGGWILGVVGQHWWDFSGDDNRQDVNLTNIQYVAFYRLNAETNIGFGGPNITINHEAASGQKLTLPVGVAWNTTIKIGPAPVKAGVELYKYVEQPDNFGADWGIRFIFSPVVPSPAFSKRPIFGN